MATANTTLTTMPTNFVPVKVEGGKKYRGRGYVVNVIESTGDYGWKHVPGPDGFYYWQRNVVTTETARIWVPELHRFQYANNRYVEADESVTPEQAALAYAEFVDFKLDDTVAWCRKQKPNEAEAEVLRFARNVIRKHSPELVDAFDKRFGFKVDVGQTVKSTIDWAFKLGYGNTKCVRIAYRALAKKGITKQDAFLACWKLQFDLLGLAKIADKVLAENGR